MKLNLVEKRKKYMSGERNNMVDGILLINKPRSITSFDVIRRIKGLFEKKQKIGHTGTLDPFATGLLIITLGKCTKLFDKFQEFKKTYVVKAEFGFETDTLDITGERVFEKEKFLKKEDLEKKLEKFTGEIFQKPPKFSAKKVKGKRAYELARKKEDFDLEKKKVFVYEIGVKDFKFPNFELEIVCSKGTYIRSLVSDIARDLDTFATATELCRTSIGEFRLENAVDIEEVDVERDVVFYEVG